MNGRTKDASLHLPDEYAIPTLRYIYRNFGHRAFGLEEFLRDTPDEAPPAAWHVGLIQLCRHRMVRLLRKSWGERLYQLPVDHYLQHFAACWPEISVLKAQQGHSEDQLILSDTYRSMTEQVLAAIIALDREPIELTRQGKMHKRSLERVGNSLMHAPNLSEETRSRLLMETIDLILRTGLARRSERSIGLDEAKVRRWLQLDAQWREEQMFMLWYRVHCPDQPGLHWLTGAVFSRTDEWWMPVAQLLHVAEQHGIRMVELEALDWLARMHTAGWLEIGTDERGSAWVRRRKRRLSGERTLIVQNDYEIIALPDTPFEVVRLLHQVGKRLSWDGVGQYRLTRESVQAAARRGWEAEDIICLLQKHALDDLPDHLVSSVYEWVEEQSGIRMYAGIVLEINDRRAAALLDWHGAELQLRKLGDRIWLAEGMSEQEAAKRLQSIGIAAAASECVARVKLEREDSDAEPLPEEMVLSMDEALSPRTPGLFAPRDTSVMYREDRPASVLDEVYPDHQKIPTSWYEQYRRYHHSTARQLIEQAMRWRTGVRVRTADEEYVVVPRMLEQRDGGWIMEGRTGSSMQISMRVEEIEQLQLLVPGLME